MGRQGGAQVRLLQGLRQIDFVHGDCWMNSTVTFSDLSTGAGSTSVNTNGAECGLSVPSANSAVSVNGVSRFAIRSVQSPLRVSAPAHWHALAPSWYS